MANGFKCRFCGSTKCLGGICTGCGMPTDKANVEQAAKPSGVYCGVCRRTQIRDKRESDGMLQCRGCRNIFDPDEDMVIAHRDPSVNAERNETYERKREHAQRRQSGGHRR